MRSCKSCRGRAWLRTAWMKAQPNLSTHCSHPAATMMVATLAMLSHKKPCRISDLIYRTTHHHTRVTYSPSSTHMRVLLLIRIAGTSPTLLVSDAWMRSDSQRCCSRAAWDQGGRLSKRAHERVGRDCSKIIDSITRLLTRSLTHTRPHARRKRP